MEILIIAAKNSSRAPQLQDFARGTEHSAICITPGETAPAAKACWGGAVYFGDNVVSMLAQIRGLQESLRYLSVPLIVVVTPPFEGVDHEILDAGADLICECQTGDEAIVQELATRCRARPIERALRTQLAEPLVTAVRQTMSQMAGVDVTLLSAYEQQPPSAALGDLAVTLALTQSAFGELIMSFSTPTAEALGRRILAEEAHAVDPGMRADCMGEIANVIAGQAKALLAGTPYYFHFSTPRVTHGHIGAPVTGSGTSVVLAFASDAGAFALQIKRQK